MIVSIFGPNGIVTATSAVDMYFDVKEENDYSTLSPIKITGLPHIFTFWNKYVLVYKLMSPYSYDSSFIVNLHELEKKWNTPPPINEFMPYLKKTIIDFNYQIQGIVSGYNFEGNGIVPYVYQILGNSVRRVNVDDSANPIFNCIYLEKTPVIWKLLQKTKILNGDNWEEFPEIRIRYDLLSIEKAIDLCCFFLKTNHLANNINLELFSNSLELNLVVMQPFNLEITNKII